MNEPAKTKTSATRTPWHLWVIGIISVLWNSGGLTDFVMTQTKNEASLKLLFAISVPEKHRETTG